jgi:putative Mg2+ transporter-C (MgtC) family protein
LRIEKEGLVIVGVPLEPSGDDEEQAEIRKLRIRLHKPRSGSLLQVCDRLLAPDFVQSLETAGSLRSQ